jgi:carbamoyltransferase
LIVLGLIGRPDAPGCHDAAACLVVDGHVVGALEQERVSGRRYAPGEGPELAARELLAAHDIDPRDVDGIGYGWADVTASTASTPAADATPGPASTTELTDVILPSLGPELARREVLFFDHHLCHAASTYFLNEHATADVLVIDGWGGDGSTSTYRAADGELRLLERFGGEWSFGLFYEAAAVYAGLGWNGAGKLMGLSSYGSPTGRRFLRFDSDTGTFAFGDRVDDLRGSDVNDLAARWLDVFESSVFPYAAGSRNVFDYAPFAADVQATLVECALAMVKRIRRLSGSPALLVTGGVALNAHMNEVIVRDGGYEAVAGTFAPHDSGAALGAALLAARALGDRVEPLSAGSRPTMFLGPSQSVADIEAEIRRSGANARAPDDLLADVADALAKGKLVAWFDGASEFGPRALGARSLLASPGARESLDRVNEVKGRAPWRPAALSLLPAAFEALDVDPPVPGLTDYMLCTHGVGSDHQPDVPAGVHVDGTTRAQCVDHRSGLFAALLATVGDRTGVAGVVNTSLNARGRPMVLTARDALELYAERPDIDVLVMPPYVLAPR